MSVRLKNAELFVLNFTGLQYSLNQNCYNFVPCLQELENEHINVCQPIVLRVKAKETTVASGSSEMVMIESSDGGQQNDVSEVDVAIIIDDVINREPRFLQNL